MLRQNTWAGILNRQFKSIVFLNGANMKLARQFGRIRRQRLSGVIEDIEQHLCELLSIAVGRRQIRRKIDHDSDIARAERLLEAIKRLGNQRSQRDWLRFRQLWARESQQLLNDRAGAQRGLLDRLEIRA